MGALRLGGLRMQWGGRKGGGGGRRSRRYRRSAAPGFDASVLDRLTTDWGTGPSQINAVLRQQLRTIRARSRKQAQNDPYARKYLNAVATNVVGRGIRFRANVSDADGRADELANDALERAWERWSLDKRLCDMGRTLTFPEIERLTAKRVAEDGELLIRKVFGKTAGPFSMALHLIDPELLDVDTNEDLDNGRKVRMGVERDEWNAPTGYYLLDQTDVAGQTDLIYHNYTGRGTVRIDASEMEHPYAVEYEGQGRGVPWMATTLWRQKMLTGYDESAIVAARAGAANVGLIKTPSGDELTGTEEADDDGGGPPLIKLEPGTAQELPEGAEWDQWETNYPHDQYPHFVKANLRAIASGLLMPYNVLGNDLERVNYSSMRSGKLDENDVWRVLQDWLVAHLHRPIYADWLRWALVSRRIVDASGRAYGLESLERFLSVEWQPRGWDWVDPQREAEARVLEVKYRLRSLGEIIRGRGGDPRKVWKEVAEERRTLEELGIPITEDEAAAAVAGGDS